jgi:hypothetical protein
MKIIAFVLDTNNNPLVGVNVLVINNGVKTNLGAATDVNGKFIIDSTLLTNSSVLQVSYVGFQTRNITIPELVDENFNIYLLDTGIQGNESEVIGTAPKTKKSNSWLWLLLFGTGIAVAASQNKKKTVKAKI